MIDTYSVASATASQFRTLPIERQDPWESRKAWQGVIAAIKAGNMQETADSKNKLESAQRELRKRTETAEESWRALFFTKETGHPIAEKLLTEAGKNLEVQSTVGVWRFNPSAASSLQRPWRGDLTPFG